MKKSILTLVVALAGILSANAGGDTFYSKITVSAETGKGYVYASDTSTIDDTQAVSETCEKEQNTTGASSDAEYAQQTYYIYAKPMPGYAFSKWMQGENVISTENPAKVVVTATSTDKNTPTEASYTALFESSLLTVKSSDNGLGIVTIDKPINNAGDEVTLKVNTLIVTPNSDFGAAQHGSNSITFEGWYNEEGECLSKEREFKYTVSKAETIEARLNREFAIKTDANNKIYGYYRLATPFRVANAANPANNTNYFLTFTGNFTPNISLNDRYLNGAAEFNQLPYRAAGNGDKYAKSEAPFSDCGSILYVTGDANADIHTATDSRKQVATNLIASAQGTSTQEILPSYKPWLKTASHQGYYILGCSMGTLQLNYQKSVWVTTDKPGNATMMYCGDLDVQPIDEEHIDINYWGALPSEEMFLEDGYWTSMYTSFPYMCYEPDGVEAYVAAEDVMNGDETVVKLKRLECGIVPAETPVLLKCRSTHVKENRLIPLMPDDERIAAAVKEAGDSNLLTGTYGLWTDKDCNGRETYNDDTMRVFSVGSTGELGFYRMEGTPELVPNRAYLDLSKLKNPAKSKIRIRFDDYTGIEDIRVSESGTTDAAPVYYNLQGQRVENPTNGIYIEVRNGKSRKVVM